LAVESIHKLNCIYGDIKADNIPKDINGLIKLSDFELAKIFDKLYENNKTKKFDKNKLIHQRNFSLSRAAYNAIFKIF
jgi:serine/threonine protein kinase